MSSHRRTTEGSHEWTNFEKHTLLCLLAKNLHLEEKGNRTEAKTGVMRQHAYMNVATALNQALNGVDGNFEHDIEYREVTKMIDRMLKEKKGVVGMGGYMERATRGRITRGLKRMWEREPGIDYNGTPGEWAQWRKKSEEDKRRVAAGGAPNPEVVVRSVENAAPGIVGDIWRQAGAGPTTVVNNATRTPVLPRTGVHASFNSLPSHLRNSDKYSWANPGAASAYRPSHAGSFATAIDSYRPSYTSTGGPQQSYSSVRPSIETSRDNYRLEPTPSLTHNYSSSSPSKGSTYSGTARPTTTVRNPYDDTHVARTIENELAKRRSEQFKRPGILKHLTNVGNPGANPGDRTPGNQTPGNRTPGARTPGYMVNPARKALFAGPDVEMGEVVENLGGRPVGMGANREDLPFNRMEQRRRDVEDTPMRDVRY